MDKSEIIEEFQKLPIKEKSDLWLALNKTLLKERINEIRNGLDLDLTEEEIVAEVRATRHAQNK